MGHEEGEGGGKVRNDYKMKKKNDLMPCGGQNWARGGRGGSRDCEINYKMQKIRSLLSEK